MKLTTFLSTLLLFLVTATRAIPIAVPSHNTTLADASACPDALIPGYCCTEGSLFKILTCMPVIHKREPPQKITTPTATTASPAQTMDTDIAAGDRGLIRRGDAGMPHEWDTTTYPFESSYATPTAAPRESGGVVVKRQQDAQPSGDLEDTQGSGGEKD